MARMPRLYIEGLPQHIIQRGNNRSACFFREADYACYLQKLKQAADAQNVRIHAYVLMTNHVHLLVTGRDADAIPNMMQSLGRCYVRYINLTYQRTGTLWEGRYKSSLVDTSSYFLTLSRYIELNPVRAHMVTLPGEYPWSSYRHNAMGMKTELITEHDEYIRLGENRAARIKNYRAIFKSEISASHMEEIRLCVNKGWVTGSDKFRNGIEKTSGRKVYDCRWGGDRRSKEFMDQVT
jgi:putative transposase